MHGKIKSIGMEIRESKERADVEEVFRKKGGTKWKKRNWKEASENQRFPDLRGKRRKHSLRRSSELPSKRGGRPGALEQRDGEAECVPARHGAAGKSEKEAVFRAD